MKSDYSLIDFAADDMYLHEDQITPKHARQAQKEGKLLVDLLRLAVMEDNPTQVQLAKWLGVSQTSVGRFLLGGGMRPEHIGALMGLYGLRITIDPRFRRRYREDE